MQIYWAQLLGGSTGPKEQGQRRHTPKLRQRTFINIKRGVLMCQPETGTVPKHHQKLSPLVCTLVPFPCSWFSQCRWGWGK